MDDAQTVVQWILEQPQAKQCFAMIAPNLSGYSTVKIFGQMPKMDCPTNSIS